MSHSTRIKICGITNLEDAQAAVAYGADALGFIAVADSPRYVEPEYVASHVLPFLPPFITPVLVVKECKEESFPPALQNFGAVQFYSGDCSTTVTGTTRCLRAFRIRDEASLQEITFALKGPRPDAILLDTYHKDKLGGSGETFNWELAIKAKQRFGLPIILAGGLTAENVGEAVRTVRPYAVDVSSGVEAGPGRKDHAKIKAFIEAVRRVDS